ncbi:hypothetical protein D3C78_1156610 [compost metagenome]
MAHTLVKEVNGFKIKHWSLGNIFYIPYGSDWIVENHDLQVVENVAKSIKR